MQKILKSLPQFTRALETHKPIICNGQGEWKFGKSRFVKIFNPKAEDPILRIFSNVLAQVEIAPLYFNSSPGALKKQAKFYENLLRAGKSVIRFHEKSKSPQLSDLKLALIKLKYRIQVENGGLRVLNPNEVDPQMMKSLHEKVEEWKRKDEKYEHTQPIDFSPKIQEICQYPEIAKFLLDKQNNAHSNEYFQRTLRDNFNIEVFNQYHSQSQELVKNFIACRIGAITRKILSVDLTPVKGKPATRIKTLNLLMENKPVNLLNKTQKIRFSNGLEWKLSRIYEDYGGKNEDPGDTEIFSEGGVMPINGHEISPRIIKKKNFLRKLFKKFFNNPKQYVPLDTTRPGWYEKTPVLDIRTKDYIEARYNIKIQPGQWVTVLEATRREKLDVDKAHGYSVFYQPIGKDKLDNDIYRVYSFGAFPLKFPQNTRELVNFVGDTVPGTVAFDPNYFYPNSQKASWPQVVDEKVAKALLNELGMRKKTGIIFQLGWENCAFFMHGVFSKVFKKMKPDVQVPKFFEKKFLNTRPHGALQVVQKRMRKTPKELLPVLKLILAIVFRATRSIIVNENGKKVRKSLWKSNFFKKLKIYLPSAAHHRIEMDIIRKAHDSMYKEKFPGCVLNYGHINTTVVM